MSRSVRATTRGAALAIVVATGAAGASLVLPAGQAAAADAVPLGTAGTFAVLAGAGVTNTGATTLHGDLGTYPTPAVTGSATLTVTGTDHGAGGVTQGAKTDLDIAYGVAAGAASTAPVTGDLGGLTLPAGVYTSASSIGLTGVLTLDGENDPDAVFIFQAGSTLTTASASQVNLIRGADPCNVFWQVGSSAGLGTGSTFVGSILALTDVTLTTGAVVDGRVLARTGAVTLDTNVVTVPTCATVTAPSATPSTGGPDASATPSGGGEPASATPSVIPSVVPSTTPSGDPVPATTTPVATPAARPAAPHVVRTTAAPVPRHTGGAARRAPARRQVRSVPSGAVAAGDGSGRDSGSAAPVTATLLAAVSLAVAGCARPLPRKHR